MVNKALKTFLIKKKKKNLNSTAKVCFPGSVKIALKKTNITVFAILTYSL